MPLHRSLVCALAVLTLAGCQKAVEPPRQQEQSSQAPKLPEKIMFHGLVMGSPDASAIKSFLGANEPCLDAFSKSDSCEWPDTYAGIQATQTLSFRSGFLWSVFIPMDSQDIDRAIQALEQTYGPPTSVENSQLRNGFGATFAQSLKTWDAANGSRIFSMRYIEGVVSDGHRGAIMLYSPQAVKAANEASAKAASQAASDI